MAGKGWERGWPVGEADHSGCWYRSRQEDDGALSRGRVGTLHAMRLIRKVGRNDPCPCGSGRKYKKCHLVLEEMRSASPSAPAATAAPVHGRQKIDALWKGKRVRAVGNRLYFRQPTETFHEFLMNVLRETLGKEWYMSEVAKAPDD